MKNKIRMIGAVIPLFVEIPIEIMANKDETMKNAMEMSLYVVRQVVNSEVGDLCDQIFTKNEH